jgi:phage terminase large subunit-like protein
VSDLTPLVWVVPCRHTEGAWDVFVRVFLPEAALHNSRNADLYRSWRDAEWLTLTPGDVVDYRRVTEAILADARQLDIRRLTIDAKFQGVQIAQTLADQGVPVMEMPQTHTAFAAPMKELGHLLKSGMLHHGANPILRWCLANLVVKADHDGGLKPDKRRSHEKIDAVVGVAMALDGVVRQPMHAGSVHDTRGIEFIQESLLSTALNLWVASGQRHMATAL